MKLTVFRVLVIVYLIIGVVNFTAFTFLLRWDRYAYLVNALPTWLWLSYGASVAAAGLCLASAVKLGQSKRRECLAKGICPECGYPLCPIPLSPGEFFCPECGEKQESLPKQPGGR